MNLFAYGTLMWPEVLESVIGRRLQGTPATLSGFLRLRVKNEHYPVVVPSDGGQVKGVLYGGLTESEFLYLDRFEGEEYDRIAVQAGSVAAQAYVLSECWRHIAEDSPWHPEQVRPKHLAAFREEYKGWRDINRGQGR